MLSQDVNPGVEFEYSLPTGAVKETPEGGERYEWQENVSWSDCSAPCGGGTKTRNILCLSVSSKEIMPPNLCDPQLKPLELDNCNTDPCEVNNMGHIGGVAVTKHRIFGQQNQRDLLLRLIQTCCSSLQIPQWTCINTETGNFLSLQNHNCLPQSAAENADSVKAILSQKDSLT